MPSPAKILAVDDEPELTDLMQYNLVRAGYEVTTAANGWEALDCIKRCRPDLILLDLMLPDLDGFGVCEILRRDPLSATIPIIIVSAGPRPTRATSASNSARSTTSPSHLVRRSWSRG